MPLLLHSPDASSGQATWRKAWEVRSQTWGCGDSPRPYVPCAGPTSLTLTLTVNQALCSWLGSHDLRWAGATSPLLSQQNRGPGVKYSTQSAHS